MVDVDNDYGLSLIKEAVKVPLIGRIGGWLAKRKPTWGGVKRFMIGEPRKFVEEIEAGKAFAPGSLIRRSLHAPGVFSKALFYGLPAYEAYHVLKSRAPDKAERMGGLLASTPVWLATWKPLGIVGSTIAGTIAERLGRQVGKAVGGKPPMTSPYAQVPPGYNPYTQGF